MGFRCRRQGLYSDIVNPHSIQPSFEESQSHTYRCSEGTLANQSLLQMPWETQLADVVESTSNTGRWRSVVVGGCCKTTDRDIARLRGVVLGESAREV